MVTDKYTHTSFFLLKYMSLRLGRIFLFSSLNSNINTLNVWPLIIQKI